MVFRLPNQEHTHMSGIKEADQFCIGKLRNFPEKCEINEINAETGNSLSVCLASSSGAFIQHGDHIRNIAMKLNISPPLIKHEKELYSNKHP